MYFNYIKFDAKILVIDNPSHKKGKEKRKRKKKKKAHTFGLIRMTRKSYRGMMKEKTTRRYF